MRAHKHTHTQTQGLRKHVCNYRMVNRDSKRAGRHSMQRVFLFEEASSLARSRRTIQEEGVPST